MDRALGGSVEPHQRQADVAPPAAEPEELGAPVPGRDFAPALATADALVRARAVGRLQRSAGNAAVAALLQREPQATAPKPGAEAKAIADRAAARQQQVAAFTRGAQTKLDSIGSHFAWVNGAYTRCWDHMTLVVSQANEQAASDAKVASTITSVALGAAVGNFFALGGAIAIERGLSRELADLVRPYASIGTGKVIGGAVTPGAATTPQPPGAAQQTDPQKSIAPHPLLAQAKTFDKERDLYRAVLDLAASALESFGPLLDVARQAEHDKEPDANKLAALKAADAKGTQLMAKMAEDEKAFDALAARQAAAQPNDRTIEQTLWVAYLGSRRTVGLAHGLSRSPNVLARHLADIGLIKLEKRPTPTTHWVEDAPPTPFEGGGGSVLHGHDEEESVPSGGLLDIYAPDPEMAAQEICKKAASMTGWAQNATATFLLENDTNMVEARP
jgi:hypothetical protein